MPIYNFRIITLTRRQVAEHSVSCINDMEAVSVARGFLMKDQIVDIWHGFRRVGELEFGELPLKPAA